MLAALMHCRVATTAAFTPITRATSFRAASGKAYCNGPSTSLGAAAAAAAASSYADFTLEEQCKHVQDALYRVRQCNLIPDEVRESLLPFVVNDIALGMVTPKTAEILCSALSDQDEEAVFEIGNRNDDHTEFLTLTTAAGTSSDSRTQAVARVTNALREAGVVTGWRDELYPVSTSFYATPTFLIERAAAPLLGCIEYGVHINGVVPDPATGVDRMWMARRSATKSKYPSMLDHIVAGGQPHGISLLENVVKECGEEAGIPEEMARANVMAAGAISYAYFEPSAGPGGALTRAVMFNYDITLPAEYKPTPVDGEVDEFFTWCMEKVLGSLAEDYKDPLKPNCYLVVVDFLLRKGLLSPEKEGYLDVLKELRGGTCA